MDTDPEKSGSTTVAGTGDGGNSTPDKTELEWEPARPGLLHQALAFPRLFLAQFARRDFWKLVLRALGVLVLLYGVANQYLIWVPDTMFIGLLILFALVGQSRVFMVRFAPFVGLLLVYESFRGIADDLNANVNYDPMIELDRWLAGGRLPTIWLQEHLWDGSARWYDFYFYFVYTFHFAAPVLLGLLLWKKRAKLYWPFVASFVLLTLAAFVTYVAFPAAPPWMASDHGRIEPVHHITVDLWSTVGIDSYSVLYAQLSPNLVAAVPSLHSAFPVLSLLILAKAFGWRRVWWVAFYPVSVWLGVVYMGDHYVVDVLLGALYAVAAFLVTPPVCAALRRAGEKAARRSRRRPVRAEETSAAEQPAGG